MAELPESVAIADSADLYACLGISPDASQADIATAYRRLSRIVHPDKRIASSSAGDASSSASTDAGDAAYQRIRRAYDVLRDSETRRIYDEFGLEGLRALTDGAVVLRGRGVAELREELVQLRRLREEAAVMKLTQPATQLTVGLNCSSVFSPIDEDQPKGIYLERLSFSQNTSFILTPKHRLVLAGSLGNMGRAYVPTVSLTMRSQLTDKLSSDVTVGLNYLPTAAGKLTYRLSPNLLASVRAEVTSMQGGTLVPKLTPSLSCQISPKCVGTLSYAWNSPNKGARAEVLWQAAEGFHGKAALFLAPNDAGGQLSCTREVGDLRMGVSCQLTLKELWSLRYHLAQKVSEYSEAGMSIRVGPNVGVRLKLSLSRGNQVYAMPIVLSEWMDPAAIVYGTAVPLLAYAVVYKCIYAPWLAKFQQQSRSQQSDTEASGRAARQAEALSAQSLMRQSAQNSRESERSRGGLIIDRAVYGYLATNEADQQLPSDSSSSVIDVTDCLQILVDQSHLEIPASLTKADLPGFYDPAPPPSSSTSSSTGAASDTRHLLIRYTFNGTAHSVLLGDGDSVRLPQRRHAVA
ncbi:hypothetical protein BOX15_Mlig001830g2 [Macrostomum lignano]|uniref:J domain-containing protein n=3 Tax=Macrostomum lignano TaxID=282301 RepID=A0A267F5Q5_9PLAT|nr:hypothetical protein BOX15_Mlig001830g2 [Macrostomum lignano]